MGKKNNQNKTNAKPEVQPLEEAPMEPKRLSDANRKQMEADQHTVGGF
ncbi:hypothetical protein [Thalassobacillus sp. CUG 92003]|nr:hypothetical protein [Thalassobacillus sp. CUG 92003]